MWRPRQAIDLRRPPCARAGIPADGSCSIPAFVDRRIERSAAEGRSLGDAARAERRTRVGAGYNHRTAPPCRPPAFDARDRMIRDQETLNILLDTVRR